MSEPHAEPSTPAPPPSQAPRTAGWIGNLLFPALLIAAAAIAYSNSFQGVFLLDDHIHIVDSPAIRRPLPITHLIRSGGARPTLPVSLALDFAWSGRDPFGYHVTNLIVHTLAGLFLFGLVRHTLRLPWSGGRFEATADWAAFAAAGLWLVHPLNTQAVTYLVQRCESMMGLGFLACLYGYVRAATSSRPPAWYAFSFAAFLFSVLSKEVGVTVAAVIPLFDRAFLAANWREGWNRRGRFWLCLAAPLAIGGIVLGPKLLVGEEAAGFATESVTPWQYFYSQPAVILHYLRLTLVPDGLCFDYGWPIENRLWLGWILPFTLIGAAFALSVVATLRGNPLGFLGLAIFIILAPTSSFVPIQDLAVEHRMYLPSALVLIGVVLGVLALTSRLPAPTGPLAGIGLLLLAFALLSFQTFARNQDYHSAIGMWEDVMQKVLARGRPPRHAGRLFSNLGESLADGGRLRDAREVLEHGLRAAPNSPRVRANLARVYLDLDEPDLARPLIEQLAKDNPDDAGYRQQAAILHLRQGDLQAAEVHLTAALALKPEDSTIQTNLGQLHLQRSQLDSAEKLFREVVRRDPGFYAARRKLANLLLETGRLLPAREQCEKLVSAAPKSADAHYLFGIVEARGNRLEEAEKLWKHALDLDERFAPAYFQLGNLYRLTKRSQLAIECYEQTVRLQPKNAEAHFHLGALIFPRDLRAAAKCFAAATQVRPNYVEAHYNLAMALLQTNDTPGGIEALKTVLKLKPGYQPAEDALTAALKSQPKTAAAEGARDP